MPDAIIPFVAIYGATLATVTFVWNVYRDRAKVRVRIVHASGMVGDEFEQGISVSVQNPSSHTVNIENISLLYQLERMTVLNWFRHVFRFRRLSRWYGWTHADFNAFEVDTRCPVSLAPRSSHSFIVPDYVLELMLEKAVSRRFVAVAQDQLWRNKYSSSFSYPELPIAGVEATQTSVPRG